MKCHWCGRELIFKAGIGWIHKDTNSIYIMYCRKCGYGGGQATACPKCGSKDYVDHHCALPDYSTSKLNYKKSF